ncbi:flagellar hook-length control protein FliK [Marinobacter caseinilyticus]|uniref:flagellar hook-length control protein FliK n=1 Tax=Marinobacter caseinilyticus TaxID=2692195 RepID=UPI001F26C5BE|nr:flagellar hook-length control protein FliK [Marinobacter caseinilyticus]
MKVPINGHMPVPKDTPKSTQTGVPVPGQTPGSVSTGLAQLLSAQVLLDRLQLENQQVVSAKVAEILNRQPGVAGDAILELRGQSLLVRAAIGETKLEPGDWVKIMRAGNELQLIAKLAPTPDTRIAEALAQRLPWQQRLDSGLSQLMAALPSSGQSETLRLTPQTLPASTQEAIRQLVARLPVSTALTHTSPASATATKAGTGPQGSPPSSPLATQVKTWIAESGLFAEARLTRTPDAALPDLKLALTRIVTTLLAQQGLATEHFNRFTPLASHELVQAPLQFPNQLPPPPAASRSEPLNVGQTLRLLAGMLNRISVNQLHSQMLTNRATADTPAPATWLIDLPWVTPQNEPRVAQLRLEQYAADEREGDDQRKSARVAEWRFSLALDLDDSGPVYFEVSLRELQVSARVWAEKQATLQQAQAELDQLRARLTELGLEVVDLDCRRGSPQGATTKLEQRLIDTRA